MGNIDIGIIEDILNRLAVAVELEDELDHIHDEEGELSQLEGEIEEQDEAIDRLEEEIEDLHGSLHSAEGHELDDIQDDIDDLESELDELATRRDVLEEEAQEYRERRQELDDAVTEADEIRDELLDVLVEIVNDIEDLDDAEELTEEWGVIVQGWRHAEGLSLRQAAGQLGTTSATLSRYENGQRTPTIATVQEQAVRMRVTSETYQARWIIRDGRVVEAEDHDDRLVEVRVRRLDQLASLADNLDIDRLDVLVRLARTPEALDAVRAVAADHLRMRLLEAKGSSWEAGR